MRVAVGGKQQRRSGSPGGFNSRQPVVNLLFIESDYSQDGQTSQEEFEAITKRRGLCHRRATKLRLISVAGPCPFNSHPNVSDIQTNIDRQRSIAAESIMKTQ